MGTVGISMAKLLTEIVGLHAPLGSELLEGDPEDREHGSPERSSCPVSDQIDIEGGDTDYNCQEYQHI